MTRFNWSAWMRAGLMGLRLTPEVFWDLTPFELRLMMGDVGPSDPAMDRRRLSDLMQAFPDQTQDLKEGD